jgi:hypothetical protein
MLYLIKLLKNLDSAITILKEGDVVPETNPINDDLSNRFIKFEFIIKGEDTTGQEEIELKNRKRN